MPDGHIARETKVLWPENLVGRWVVEYRFGMDSGLVCECDITTAADPEPSVAKVREGDTYVMGFEKGTLTSTASATRFSISRSIPRLYLDLT
jgi:hypothetical protein